MTRADTTIMRMEDALSLIIAARHRCAPPKILADAIDAAGMTLFATTGRVVTDSPPEARAPRPGTSAAEASADRAAAAPVLPNDHLTPRRPYRSRCGR